MKKTITILSLLLCLSFSNTTKAQGGGDPFIGEIIMFAGNFAPRGWALCDGQLLSISQNSALFSILGTTYGGDGRVTFGLPDLRGRVPMHPGNGPGLTPRSLGASGGAETTIITIANMPSHNHTINAIVEDGNQSTAAGNLPAGTKLLDQEYSDGTGGVTTTQMNGNMVNNNGGGQAVNNVQPFRTVNYIIALEGVYPPRN